MPWEKSEPMDQRVEFCVKAVQGGNFRALCRVYGISAKGWIDPWAVNFVRADIGPKKTDATKKIKKAA